MDLRIIFASGCARLPKSPRVYTCHRFVPVARFEQVGISARPAALSKEGGKGGKNVRPRAPDPFLSTARRLRKKVVAGVCPENTLPNMRSTGFVGLVIVVAVGGYFYTSQLKKVAATGGVPTTVVSVTGVRNDLLSMANAQKRYLATHPTYASLDELRADGDIHIPSRPDFVYAIDADNSHFTITATYTGPDKKAPRRLRVDDSMIITTD